MKKTPRLPARRSVDPDLVDRIFDYLASEYPIVSGPRLNELKDAVRAEFKGEWTYISARSAEDRHRQAQQVLALFNGRNAREVARRLGISRATVYRVLKQPAQPRQAGNSLTFPGNETAHPVRSRRDRTSEKHAERPAEAALAPTITD